MPPDDPTLREHLEALLAAERELREAEIRARDERIESARREIDHRFEGVEAQDERIAKVENFVSNITGRLVGLGALGAIFIAVTASVVTRLIVGGSRSP